MVPNDIIIVQQRGNKKSIYSIETANKILIKQRVF